MRKSDMEDLPLQTDWDQSEVSEVSKSQNIILPVRKSDKNKKKIQHDW